MRRASLVLGVCVLIGCAGDGTDDAETAHDEPVQVDSAQSEPAPVEGAAEPVVETDAGEVTGNDAPVASVDREVTPEPALPIWWFESPLRRPDRVSVCLQAFGDSPEAARDAVGAQLIEFIAAEYGETPVQVDVRQDITMLLDGRVRLAARFDIEEAPADEEPDG